MKKKPSRKYGFKAISPRVKVGEQAYECYVTVAIGSWQYPDVVIAAPTKDKLKDAFVSLTGHRADERLCSPAVITEVKLAKFAEKIGEGK